MSKEHAKKFVEHLKRDETLRKKVKDASEHIVKVAKEHGYDVTPADISGAVKEHWSSRKDDDDVPETFFSETPGF
jgi:predicted ribosomally synthesized peptide with nif11-like leader